MSRLAQRDIADTLLPAEEMTDSFRFNHDVLYAQARQLQAEALAEGLRWTGRGLRNLGRSVVGFWSALIDAVHMQRTVNALYSLDDRTLADIGLKRDEIPLAVQAMLERAHSGQPLPTLAEALQAREIDTKAAPASESEAEAAEMPVEELRRAA